MEQGSMYCAEQINIPQELSTIMKHFTKAVIREEPQNLYKWSANYFAALANMTRFFGDDGTYLQGGNQLPTQTESQQDEKQQQETAEQHKQVLEDEATPNQLLQLAHELCENGQYPKALEYLNEAAALDRDNSEIYFKRGILKHHFLQDIDGGYQDYTDCVTLNPTHCDAYRYRADLLLFHTQNLQEALEDYNNAIQLGRSDADTFTCRGELHRKLGNADAAISDINDALKLDDTFPDAYKCRGDIFQWLYEDLNPALEDYNKAAELGRNDSDLLVNRGELLRKMGDNDAAMQDLTDAIQADPNNLEAYQYRAILFHQIGDIGAAVEDMRTAVDDLGAQDPELLGMKQQLEELLAQQQ